MLSIWLQKFVSLSVRAYNLLRPCSSAIVGGIGPEINAFLRILSTKRKNVVLAWINEVIGTIEWVYYKYSVLNREVL